MLPNKIFNTPGRTVAKITEKENNIKVENIF
jgi:hypothetical protein